MGWRFKQPRLVKRFLAINTMPEAVFEVGLCQKSTWMERFEPSWLYVKIV